MDTIASDFVAVDVETANPDLSSICQVGIAVFTGQQDARVWQSYVDPQDYFAPQNTSIHGISEDHVKDAPTFPQVYAQLNGFLADRIVVTHTPFDRVALQKSCEKFGLPGIGCKWLDSARVVRRAWPQFSRRGYGLSNIARHLELEFEHHVAGEDARAAGEIVLKAIATTGSQLSEWLQLVERPIHKAPGYSRTSLDGSPDGHLVGEVAVFTGALSIPRKLAAEMAAGAGCDVATSVTKKTTLLVVGEQDLRRLAGHRKSSKHRRAEELIKEGQYIRILGEDDFRRLIES